MNVNAAAPPIQPSPRHLIRVFSVFRGPIFWPLLIRLKVYHPSKESVGSQSRNRKTPFQLPPVQLLPTARKSPTPPKSARKLTKSPSTLKNIIRRTPLPARSRVFRRPNFGPRADPASGFSVECRMLNVSPHHPPSFATRHSSATARPPVRVFGVFRGSIASPRAPPWVRSPQNNHPFSPPEARKGNRHPSGRPFAAQILGKMILDAAGWLGSAP
jgi:hypothetical protein